MNHIQGNNGQHKNNIYDLLDALQKYKCRFVDPSPWLLGSRKKSSSTNDLTPTSLMTIGTPFQNVFKQIFFRNGPAPLPPLAISGGTCGFPKWNRDKKNLNAEHAERRI